MLKIKDEVELKELEKFGFLDRDDESYVKKVYLKNDNDDKNLYVIYKKTHIIDLARLDGELDDTLYDLIKANLVEKVDG